MGPGEHRGAWATGEAILSPKYPRSLLGPESPILTETSSKVLRCGTTINNDRELPRARLPMAAHWHRDQGPRSHLIVVVSVRHTSRPKAAGCRTLVGVVVRVIKRGKPDAQSQLPSLVVPGPVCSPRRQSIQSMNHVSRSLVPVVSEAASRLHNGALPPRYDVEVRSPHAGSGASACTPVRR